MELNEIVSLHPSALENFFATLSKEQKQTAVLIEDNPNGLLISYMDREASDVIRPTSLGLHASTWKDRVAIRIDKFRFASTQVLTTDSSVVREAKDFCFKIMSLVADEPYVDRVDLVLNNLLLLIENLKVECDSLFEMNNEFQNELDWIMLDEQSTLDSPPEFLPIPELNISTDDLPESTPKAKTGKRGKRTSKSNLAPLQEEEQQ